jgi:hypothetical protein
MNEIINNWSYNKQSNNTNDLLALYLCNYYSKENNLDLQNLNLLNETFNNHYWFICKKTNELYFLNMIINNYENKNLNITQALSEINRNVFKQITINIDEQTNLPRKKYIHTFNLDINNKHYCIKNISIINNSIQNFNKPSRSARYIKRNILKFSNKIVSDISNDLKQNKKRKNDEPELEQQTIKKPKIDDFCNMVSASSIRNYMLNDPLIDYLKEYNIYSLEDKNIRKIPNSRASIQPTFDTFTKCILDAGIEFEDELIKIIKRNHKVVKVAEFIQCKKKEKLEETIDLMRKGTPIIYQAVLHNYENETFGMPDLLVRSDYINKLLGYQVITDEEAKIPSPKLGVKFHYKVIDIKHSNISLRADGLHILNSDSIPAYKGQIYIYMLALNNILGININKAYVWGKKYNYESKGEKYNISNFLNKLGIINYDTVDSEYINKTNDAIKWIKTVRNEGSEWYLLPLPCRNELFPNMKNEKDGPWRKIKNELNDNIHEITRVWNCGVRRRNHAHSNKVYSWKNPKCTSKIMGFNTGKIASTVDAILDINRQNKDIIRPGKILFDRNNWFKTNKNTMNFYLDFETLNSNFGSIIKDGIISYDNNQFIFMIGIGYAKNNKWEFKSFLLEEKTDESELLMFNEFNSYINNILKENKKKEAKFYHWSWAEPCSYNRFKNKNNKFKDNNLSFYDLNKVFISEPVIIKDALDFSLKTIAKALHKYKLINSCWDLTSPCSNGLTAMILANKIYENKSNSKIIEEPIMKEIIYYNEIDCKVLWEIHEMIKIKM